MTYAPFCVFTHTYAPFVRFFAKIDKFDRSLSIFTCPYILYNFYHGEQTGYRYGTPGQS